MTRQRITPALLLLAALWLSGPVWSQPPPGPGLPAPRLLLVFPMGGKAGSALEVTVTGQELDDATELYFSRPGIKSELVGPVAGPDVKKQPNLGKTTSVKFKVTIPADTPPGIHDLRVSSPYGVSNPRAFVVGDLPEVNEEEPNNDVGEAQRVELNSTVNGVISTPTDVDYYIFKGKKGQRVVLSCLASSIDSKLHAALQLYRGTGAPLAFGRDYNGNDAVADAVLPADDDYYVRVFAFTYTQGGPEHFYRLSISTAPWIDAIYPPVVEPGKEATLTVYGRNLPGGKPDPAATLDGSVLEKAVVKIKVPQEPADARLAFTGFVPPRSAALNGFEYRLRNDAGSSNPYLLTFARAPVVLDNEANDTADTAQAVTPPCEIAGRIEKKRDRDWYRFPAKKGEVYSIEVLGDRLGAPLDLYYTLRAADAKTGQEFDDNPEVLHPTQFFTRTEDPPRQRFVAPADGTYLLQVSSREADIQAGPRHLYRVRITREQPDYQLIVMPPTPNLPEGVTLRRGGAQYYTVFVWRQDGFRGEVALSAEGLPRGVTCPPQTVGPDQKQGVLVLAAAPDAAEWTGALAIKGTATIDGRKVERAARAATVTWPVQQNQVTVSRLDRTLALAVRDQAPCRLTAGIDQVTLVAGEKKTVPVKLERLWPDLKGSVQVSAILPQGQQGQGQAPVTFNNNQPLTLAPGKSDAGGALEVKTNAPPGVYTLVLRATATLPFAKSSTAKQKPNVTITEVSQPIVVTVLPKQVATVTLAPASPTVKAGKETEIVVKVSRQFDFAGEFKVELVVPDNVKGVSAEPVTIAAGKDEAKLILRVAPDAARGTRSGLLVRAHAQFADRPITQEAKLTVSVNK